MTDKWKTTAIIAIILVVIEAGFIGWIFYYGTQYEKDNYECLYDICNEYDYAEFLDPICYCYEYDLLGELITAKTEYMK